MAQYEPLGNLANTKDKIRVGFTFPVRSTEVAPTYFGMTDAIYDALGDRDFSGEQSQQFTYKMRQISAYKETKLAFGSNINVAQIFDMDANVAAGNISSNSGLIIDFSQTYFSMLMDLPYDGNIFKTEDIRQSFLSRNPVYINSVNFGRKGIILVESSEEYNSLSVAVRAGFNAGIVNGELSLDSETKRILSNASISICIIGGDGQDAVKTVKGFDEFQNYIVNGGVYTTSIFGVPISFTGAYAHNNQVFETEFYL